MRNEFVGFFLILIGGLIVRQKYGIWMNIAAVSFVYGLAMLISK